MDWLSGGYPRIEKPRTISRQCQDCGGGERVDGTDQEPQPLYCSPAAPPVAGQMPFDRHPDAWEGPRYLAPCPVCGGTVFSYVIDYRPESHMRPPHGALPTDAPQLRGPFTHEQVKPKPERAPRIVVKGEGVDGGMYFNPTIDTESQ